MMKIKRIKLILLFCLLNVISFAQTNGYRYQSELRPVDSSGFYNIILTPEIDAHLKKDHSDLRIVNDSGRWMPHVTWKPGEHSTLELPPHILKILKQDGSDLIVEGKDSSTNELTVEIRNTLAERNCSISGSDDMLSWFTINDSVLISPEKKEYNDNSEFTLRFPKVNYKYFKIHFFNNGKQPFSIVRIKTMNTPVFFSSYKEKYFEDIENPNYTVIQMDSGNNSYIKVMQARPYHFDKISLTVSGAKYFNRHADIYFPSYTGHSFSNPGQLQQSIVLSNNSTLEFKLPVSNPDVFYIIVRNQDNPPLKITQVKTNMSYTVATAWLEKNVSYKLLLDNPMAIAPAYDLRLKDIDVQKEWPIVKNGAVSKMTQIIITEKTVTRNKGIIWFVIALAVIVLGYFTYKLIHDMNRSKS